MILVILAAGMGSRYGGIKQVEPVGEHKELLIDYSIYDAVLAGFDKVVFIIRRDIENIFRERIFDRISKRVNATYVFQDLDALPDGFKAPAERAKPWGTVHALLVARKEIDAPFCMVNADDFYGREAYEKMAAFFNNLKKEDKHKYAMVGYKLRNTISDNGTVNRAFCEADENQMLLEMVERLGIKKDGEKLGYTVDGEGFYEIEPDTNVSMNILGFTPDVFPLLEKEFKSFLEKNISQPKTECIISNAIGDLIDSGTVSVKMLTSHDKWLGFTYPEDKYIVKAGIDQMISAGIYPSPLWKD